jgi:hypothetical protein
MRLLRQPSRSVGLDVHRDRVGHADRVRELDQRAFGDAGGDEVLGHVASHVGGGSIHLRRVLSRERAAAVRGAPAVGIHDDLPTRETGVSLRPADDEAAGRVDVVFRLGGQESWRNHRLDDLLDDRFAQLRVLHCLGVLGGDDNGLDGHRAAPFVFHRDLGLAVGAQEVHLPVTARLREPLHQPVREGQRQGISSSVSRTA